jgi:cytidylate kinase
VKDGQIIVISREYGSGGSEIGMLLAQQLGIPYYDKNFVDTAVKNSGLSTDFLEEEEQKFISSLLFNLATGGYRHSGDKAMADQVYIAESNAIKEVAQQGSCVIVGRCADHILKDDYDVFSVFVNADLAWRVKRAVENCGVAPRRAEQTVRDKDRSRARHYEYYTDKDWGDNNNYHLCINSGRFGIEKSVELIKKALELI